jgi:cytochrome P450
MTVGDLTIPIKKGTLVCTQTITTHYKDSIYKNPKVFDPHRFLDKNGNMIYPEPFTFMNFSAGTRGCVGRQLAMTEMKTFLAMLVNDYDVIVEDKYKRIVFESFAINLDNVSFRLKPLVK